MVDDATNYGVKISLPPLGKTQVVLRIEQLLFRKRHEIEFQEYPCCPICNRFQKLHQVQKTQYCRILQFSHPGRIYLYESGAVVGLIVWLGIERSQFPKRTGLKDFGLVDLPFPLRPINPILSLGFTCKEAFS